VLDSASAATDLDLISYLRSIPDARMWRGVRFPAWYLLLVAVLDELDLDGVLIQADALHTQRPFFGSSRSAASSRASAKFLSWQRITSSAMAAISPGR